MGVRHFYWGSVAVLLWVHFYQISFLLPFNLPFYITMAFAIGIVLLASRSRLLHLDALDAKEHLLLYVLQILNLSMYYFLESGWGILVPLVPFLLLEIHRQRACRELFLWKKLVQTQSEEMKHLNETFLVTRKERHDFLKHISAMHYMLEKEQFAEATTYLDELVEGYKETNLSIQVERGTVAGILHHNYRRGKENGLEVVYDLETSISSLPLSDKDVTALIGNILENAMDAGIEFQTVKGKQAQVVLQAYKRSGLFILNCKNDSLPLPDEILDNLFQKKVPTTKSGDHEGLGTQIIAEIVGKYNGYLDYPYQDETFTLHITTPAIGG